MLDGALHSRPDTLGIADMRVADIYPLIWSVNGNP